MPLLAGIVIAILQATLGDAERRNAAYRHMHRDWVAGARRELTALG